MLWLTKSKKGFTLIEIVISLSIFLIISSALTVLLQLTLKITTDDKAKNGALAIAQEKMEIIKNLPYQDIGLEGGLPSGDILAEEKVVLNKTDYSVSTDIRYVDDSFDGLISEDDLLNTDYKQIRVEVSWPSKISSKPITLITNISPKNLEQEESGETGTLWLEVYNSNAEPLANANINITSEEIVPSVNINSTTNASGLFILPGALPATQSYQIIITKDGYSSSQTYSVDLENNPNPDPAHLSVGLNEITNKTFFIDLLSNLNINFKTYDTEENINNFPFSLQGEKTIGSDNEEKPIYKYENYFISDVNGQVNITELEYDNYSVNFDNVSTNYDLAGFDNALPLILAPGITKDLNIYLAPHTTNSLLLTIKDESVLQINEANIRLYKTDLSFDVSQNTNSRGQTFFSDLETVSYNLEITKEGYLDNLLEININEQTEQTILLSAI